MIRDYDIYEFDFKEKMVCMVQGMVLNSLVAVLFYNSWMAMVPGMVLTILFYREKKRILARRRLNRMRMELEDFFNFLIASLQTGRSIENAFSESVKDLKRYSGKDTVLILELKRICSGIGVGEPLEKLLLEFSDRSHLEELEYFSEVFSVAKRSGGNVIGVMKNTIYMIQERMDAEAEIRTVIAEKELEFYVMCIIPPAIILYLRLCAGDFFSALYGNFTGVAVMTVCLLIYGGSFLYGKKLLEIEN